MESKKNYPKTLVEAICYFSDPDTCVEFISNLRWPDGITCPECGGKDHYYIRTRRNWQCKNCNKTFTVKLGTIMEDSPIPLDKWLIAFWLIANAKNRISSYELARAIGITQKSAWFLLHRIRLAMQVGSFSKSVGKVVVNETYIGGKAHNMYYKGKRKAKGRGAIGKTIVLGFLERRGNVVTRILFDTKKKALHDKIEMRVERGAQVFIDAFPSYLGLNVNFIHCVIDHAKEYVQGHVHTNGIENFWSLLKRTIKETYVSIEPFHLFRYLDEQTFRFNNRRLDDFQRFIKTVMNIDGRRLTYKQLIGEEAEFGSLGSAVANA